MLTICVVTGCTTDTLPANERNIALRGVITPVPLDLINSTTHHFTDVDGMVYKAKSNIIFLREYEALSATIIGDIQYQAHSAPILTITSVQEVHEKRIKEIQIPTLGINLSIPSLWQLTSKNGVLTIAMQQSGATVTLANTTLTVVPTGTSVSQSLPAVRVSTEFGDSLYYLASPVGIISLRPSAIVTLAQMQELLQIITLLPSSSSVSSAAISQSGSLLPSIGPVCGGSAGLLCPTHYYCNVTDTVTSIGRCALIK